MRFITNNRTYILLLWLCLGVASTTLQAQIYSTASYRGISTHRNTPAFEASSFSNTPSFGSTSSMRLRSTSEKSYHDYGTGAYNIYSSYQSSKRFIRTKAAAIQGGVVADNVGYIATNPQRTVTYPTGITPPMKEGEGDGTYDDDSTQEPPGNEEQGNPAPLGLGWDALILLLLIATAYALYIRRHKVQIR